MAAPTMKDEQSDKRKKTVSGNSLICECSKETCMVVSVLLIVECEN
jgi:hypothetical protein